MNEPSSHRRTVLAFALLAGAFLSAPSALLSQEEQEKEETGDFQPAAAHEDHGMGQADADAAVPLYDNLGSHHRAVTVRDQRAQAYFDQGLRLQYGFNHAEAVRSYEQALALDPSCAMCWWGIALALGPNINAPMDEESGARAYEAIGRAKQRAGSVTPVERALIEALAARYAENPAAERAPLDSAYARAMKEVVETHPHDQDVLTLYAASLMNLSPWNYWTGEYDAREPRPHTPEILASLEHALELNPNNPGACHYYIHAVEAAYPEKAEPCADRLASLMPGAGHLVHMPGHIYIRVGRYADAVRANEHAVHADESYIADQNPTGIYPLAYYPHNYHFMGFAALMGGMGEKALEAARIVAPKVPVEIAREVEFIQQVVVYPQLMLVSFGHWDEVLEEPMPSDELPMATAMAHYARGTAFAATGRTAEAETELEALRAVAATAREDGTPTADAVLSIAEHSLQGEIALRGGDPAGAAVHFRVAAQIEDGMKYEEPPLWYYPVRHSLGRALLEAGRAEEAEAAYRQDLARFPENGWSLYGLARALEAQGKAEEAEEAMARFREAWSQADVEITASRL